MTIEEILLFLQTNASATFKQTIVKLGIPAENTFGVSTATLRKLAKKLPKEKAFLFELWETNYHECKILTILALAPETCNDNDIQQLMAGIHSWDLCDLFCKTMLIKTADFPRYIDTWITSEQLYYKRAAFTLIASTSVHADLSLNQIDHYLQLIAAHADDDRLLVKKASAWALKELGKTNERAQQLSIATAEQLLASSSKHSQWVAKTALKELTTLVAVTGRQRLIPANSKMGRQR